jgi:RimJ/RimL family protein N-acetyltransferase
MLPDIYAFYVDCDPKSWIEHLPEIFPQPPIPIARHHYVCTRLAFDPPVPEGYDVRRIDQTLLDTPGLVIPDHVHEWAVNNWGSIPAFLDRGFGFCAVHGDQVASWSLADCISGTACEIGIQTRPDYRRRGLAALTVSAAVKYALAVGFKSVGWHCNESNLGSIGVATKVGFRKERDYIYYECVRHEAYYLAAMAYGHSQNGDHAAAAEGYKRACASPDQPPWGNWYWFLTALSLCRIDQYQDAMIYLQGAVERGYDDLEAIRDEDEFEPLHKYPAWTELLQRLNA